MAEYWRIAARLTSEPMVVHVAYQKDKTIDGEDPCQYHVHFVGLRTDLIEVANKHCKSWVEGCLDEKEDNTYNYQVEVQSQVILVPFTRHSHL